MGIRQRRWARDKRVELELYLGSVCKCCGIDRNLEFDCIVPQGSEHHRIEWSWRISFYNRQYKERNLQLLCAKCHQRKTAADQTAADQKFPF